MKNVRGYLPGVKHGRTKRLAEIFGCDRRTAQRLLNTPASKAPRIRRVYLKNAVKYTGVPAVGLTGRVVADPEIQQHMRRLNDSLPKLDRFKALSTLAMSMTAHCMFGCELPASFVVHSNKDMEPFAMHIEIRKLPSNNILQPMETHSVVVDRDTSGKWCLRYVHPREGSRFKGHLTDVNYERILQHIKSL